MTGRLLVFHVAILCPVKSNERARDGVKDNYVKVRPAVLIKFDRIA